MKWNISYSNGNFLQNRTTITRPPLPGDPICTYPRNVWLVRCLIYHLRNLKCIFLNGLLLYQLTSRQHFYFGRQLREIREIWGNCSDIEQIIENCLKCFNGIECSLEYTWDNALFFLKRCYIDYKITWHTCVSMISNPVLRSIVTSLLF